MTTYPGVDRTGNTKSAGLQAAIDNVAGKSACTSTSICTLSFRKGTYLARQLFLRSKVDPAAWTNHVHYSGRVTYGNVKVLDDRIKFNTDAMDVDASTNVTVRSSFYHGRDDGFCVKATKELGLIKASRNIRFLDNTVGYGNDIAIRNLYVTNAARPFGVYVHDGNVVGPTTGTISSLRIGGVLRKTLTGARIAKNARTSDITIR